MLEKVLRGTKEDRHAISSFIEMRLEVLSRQDREFTLIEDASKVYRLYKYIHTA